MNLRSLAILTTIVALAGCALPSSTNSSSLPDTGQLSGNWQLSMNSTQSPYSGPGSTPVAVVFNTTNGAVSGLAIMQAPIPLDCVGNVPCGFPEAYLGGNLAGTVDSSGNFSLTAATAVGSNPTNFTLTGQVSGGTLTGTFALAVGSFTDQGTVSGTYIQPVNGTYMGTVVSSITGVSMGVTAVLDQGSTVNSRGFLPLTGTVAFTNSPCLSATTVAAGSAVLGQGYGLGLAIANGATPAGVEGGVSPDAKTLGFSYDTYGSGCAFDYGQGTLTRQ